VPWWQIKLTWVNVHLIITEVVEKAKKKAGRGIIRPGTHGVTGPAGASFAVGR